MYIFESPVDSEFLGRKDSERTVFVSVFPMPSSAQGARRHSVYAREGEEAVKEGEEAVKEGGEASLKGR